MHRYFILVFACLVCLLAACSDSSDKALRDDPPPPSGPPIETDPALSFDRRFIMYVHTDTIYPTNNGVFLASTGNPVPFRLFTHIDAWSPSANADISTAAFLDSSGLVYYNVGTKQFAQTPIDTNFTSVFFVSDSRLIGYRPGYIYTIDRSTHEVALLRNGLAPTFYQQNHLLWVNQGFGQSVSLVLTDLTTDSDSTLVAFDFGAPIVSISHIPGSGRIVLVTGTGPYSIRTMTLPGTTTTLVATTQRPGAELTQYNEIVYTSNGGELWRCDFDGNNSREYRGTDSP